jgi:hypothetical protein
MFFSPGISEIMETNTQLIEINVQLREEIERLTIINQSLSKTIDALLKSNQLLLKSKTQPSTTQSPTTQSSTTQSSTIPETLGFEKRCNDLCCAHTRCDEIRKKESEKNQKQLSRYHYFQKTMTKCPTCAKTLSITIRRISAKISCTCGYKWNEYFLSKDDIHYIEQAIIQKTNKPTNYVRNYVRKEPPSPPPKSPLKQPLKQQVLRRSPRLQKKQKAEEVKHLLDKCICPRCPGGTTKLNPSPSGSYLKCNSCGFYSEKANGGWKS